MSYDVTVGCGSENYTYNIARMLYEDGFSWHDYAGQRVPIVAQRLDILIANMERDPARFKRHDPKNGWGDYHGCLEWLRTIRGHCANVMEYGDPWRVTVDVS